jgi:hypothetical protein
LIQLTSLPVAGHSLKKKEREKKIVFYFIVYYLEKVYT